MLLVTGASGLLGMSLMLQGRDAGAPVTGLYRRHPPRIAGVSTHPVDLTNFEQTRELVRSIRPAAMVHCAAATDVDWCEEHPQEAEQINAQVSSNLAELAQQLGAQFVYVSTDAVFDGLKGFYREDDEPSPVNIYGRSKLLGEQAVFRKNPLALIARVNFYGWNAQKKFSLAEWILDQLERGKQVPGFLDVHFTPLLANDLAGMLLSALDRRLTGLYHVAGSERISKFDFARRLAALFSFAPAQVLPMKVVDSQLRAKRPADISLCSEGISRALGKPMPDVQSGLQRFKNLRDAGYPQLLKQSILE